ncbi:MAG: hypothetical protein IKI32_09350 [Lachnospiraceae bacterium]|nr:hypothetical protein [Lachnospiraceae bacterium]MBR3244204.1 hypothetical protein [Parasporobacterium sp.]MBR7077109.1 hypothetical protein [Lachnospiraceae bacterium]
MTDNKVKYEERMNRINTAIALKEPDRVPIIPFAQCYPVLHAGHTMAEALYDANVAKDGIKKYLLEYEPDMGFNYYDLFAGQGPIMDKMGLKFIQWAGQKGSIVPDNCIHQFVEKEYLEEDEFAEYVQDQTGWIQRKYFPRCYENLKGIANMDLRGAVGWGFLPAMMQFANPEILESIKTMTEIAPMVLGFYKEMAEFEVELEEMGFPVQYGATVCTAFDNISDTLRGTMGIMMDLFDQPEIVHQAIDMIYPSTIGSALAQMQNAIGKWVHIPLHKGMDGFMSPAQYDEFYWPTLKGLIMAILDAGYTPYIYTEGKYDSRLERLTDLPDGKVVIHFESVDMKEAKRIVGPHSCITGGFNGRLLESGTVDQVKDEVKRVLDIYAPGGGYMFDVNDTMDDCKPENVEAMFETVREYGKY